MLQIQSGDDKALEQLWERYGNIVLGIGLKVLRDREEAEDLVQDVFFQIYRKCRHYDASRGPARAWLLRVAYHRSFDRREYLQVRRFYTSRSVDEVAEEVQSATDIEHEALISQSGSFLRRALEELNEKQRRTLTLFFFEDYTLREISEQLQESLANIRHHYYRGLRQLRDSVDLIGRHNPGSGCPAGVTNRHGSACPPRSADDAAHGAGQRLLRAAHPSSDADSSRDHDPPRRQHLPQPSSGVLPSPLYELPLNRNGCCRSDSAQVRATASPSATRSASV